MGWWKNLLLREKNSESVSRASKTEKHRSKPFVFQFFKLTVCIDLKLFILTLHYLLFQKLLKENNQAYSIIIRIIILLKTGI